MPEDPLEIEDLDFAGEMHHLAYEAQGKAAASPPRSERKELMLAIGQMVRPLAIELETIKRSMADNSMLLTILGKAAKAPPPEPAGLERISQQLQRLGAVETANQKLFDALHTELKGYKDNFLFDALQRPFIRDLVSIFDDFAAVQAQVANRLSSLDGGQHGPAAPAPRAAKVAANGEADPAAQTEPDFLRALAGNVDNQMHHLQEVFSRMEVVVSQSPAGTALDKKMHRTVGFEPAPAPVEDATVARSLKPGFLWRDRMVRPEEVIIYRWLAETETAASTEQAPPPEPEAMPAVPPESRRSSAEGKTSKPK